MSEEQATRKELLNWVNRLEDGQLLTFLDSIRISHSTSEKDWWDNLSKGEIENIRIGLKDISDGKTLSSDTFWQQLKNG